MTEDVNRAWAIIRCQVPPLLAVSPGPGEAVTKDLGDLSRREIVNGSLLFVGGEALAWVRELRFAEKRRCFVREGPTGGFNCCEPLSYGVVRQRFDLFQREVQSVEAPR